MGKNRIYGVGVSELVVLLTVTLVVAPSLGTGTPVAPAALLVAPVLAIPVCGFIVGASRSGPGAVLVPLRRGLSVLFVGFQSVVGRDWGIVCESSFRRNREWGLGIGEEG